MPIPRLGKWDSRRDQLADPYRFIGRTCIDLGSDVFATRLQTALFDGAASGLLPHLGARIARKQGERWLVALVRDAREGRTGFAEGSIAQKIAMHRPGRFEFVPQGGGEVSVHHRCPGEDVAVRLMMLGLRMLVQRMRYRAAAQNLSIAMDRLPAIPRDGFVIEQVRAA